MLSDKATMLVLGANGQVGRALVAILGVRCIALDRTGADLSSPQRLPEMLQRHDPSVVINAAAYTAVDRAESERDIAMTVNGDAPGVLARWCATRGVPLIHFSTDYVFAGDGNAPWNERDAVAPLNAYGESKLAGEQAIAAEGGLWMVLRTSWVYDGSGRNFLTTMMRLGREREAIKVVADQHGSPTYAADLAAGTLDALASARAAETFPSGIYHLCNAGDTTWHGFASAIFEEARARGIALNVKDVSPITSHEYPVPAPRPFNSRLDTSKARTTLGVALRDWREALSDCMDSYEDH